jgi:hypothetical protein
MKEFLQSILESSNERIKNPFIGSYITSFLVYNWRPIFLLLFSDAMIEDKIVVINNVYCPKAALLWPLAIALFYVLLLPYINLLFDYILSFSNAKKDKKKKFIILNNLKHKKEEAKLEREIAEERAGTGEVTELKNQIERLTDENKNLSQQNSEGFDRYNKSMEISKENERSLFKEVKDLTFEVNNVKKEFDEFITENSELLRTPLHSLNITQREYFKRYADFLTKKNKSVIHDESLINLFKQLNLVKKIKEPDKVEYDVLTNLGRLLYNNKL